MGNDVAAGVFGKVFNALAKHPRKNRELALEIWGMVIDYELDYFLMGCDDSLIKLGLAKKTEEGHVNYK